MRKLSKRFGHPLDQTAIIAVCAAVAVVSLILIFNIFVGRTEPHLGSQAQTPNSTCVVEICDGFDNDCDGQIDEGNVCAAPTATPPVLPDLRIGGLNINPNVDGTYDIAGIIRNISQAIVPYGNYFYANLYINPSQVPPSASQSPDARQQITGPMASNGSTSVAALNVPLLPNNTICVWADTDGQLTESNEQNNVQCYNYMPGNIPTPTPTPTLTCLPETCDGLDNDCDGVIDNGNVCQPPTNTPKPTKTPTPTFMPGCSKEICDGLDNDCDGLIDEGKVCVTPTNTPKPTKTPTPIPTSTPTIPPTATPPTGACTQEVCDGIDNNCDGAIDEGNACSILTPTLTPTPDQQCNVPEVCDGLDNNCNGMVDEGGVCGPSITATSTIAPPPPQLTPPPPVVIVIASVALTIAVIAFLGLGI